MLSRRFRYKFKRLSKGEIRLVTLLPGDEPSAIKCQLYTAALSDNPSYDALSYQWGTLGGTEQLLVLNNRTFVVGFNLLSALRHLRDAVNRRVLWIDAICINQHNDTEKEVQIEQMGRVYSQATSVLVWLGNSIGYADNHFGWRLEVIHKVALEVLRRLAREPLSDEDITSIFKATSYPTLDWILERFLHGNPYWSRLWILQEVLLGRRICLCIGHEVLPWQTLHVALAHLRQYLRGLNPEPKDKGYLKIFDLTYVVEYSTAASLDLIRATMMSADESLSPGVLRRLLGLAQRANSYKLSDKVFGLLGMVDFHMPIKYEVYDKHPFELYCDSMHYFRNALLSHPREDPAFYTVKLSQIFQALLNDRPFVLFPREFTSSTVRCLRMTGVLSGRINHLASHTNPDIENLRESFDADDEMTLRMQKILVAVEETSGYRCPAFNRRQIHDLIVGSTLQSFQACKPHYFHATRTSSSSQPETKSLLSTPRVGKVPIDPSKYHFDRTKANLFVASRMQESTSYTAEQSDIRFLFGVATPNARNGDLLVRFLESEFCLVVRENGSEEYEFVGCARIPNSGDSLTDHVVLEKMSFYDCLALRGSAPTHGQFDEALEHGQGVDFVVDIETLQFLTNLQ